jgi:hypothetical protein
VRQAPHSNSRLPDGVSMGLIMSGLRSAHHISDAAKMAMPLPWGEGPREIQKTGEKKDSRGFRARGCPPFETNR